MVTVRHESALMHDNSDCLERATDAITRAQNSQRAKGQLMHKCEEALRRAAVGEHKMSLYDLTGDGEAYLGGYLYELLAQVDAVR